MNDHPLLDESRRSLRGHRMRGLPAFWLGLISLILSLLGATARLDDIAPLRRFARSVLSSIPPGGTFYREHFYFSFEKFPFAATATLIGLALLVWGVVELQAASRLKRELFKVEDAHRKQQLLKELEAEKEDPPSS